MKNIYKNIILLIFTLAISLIAGEIILQIYFKKTHFYWLFKGDKNFKVGYTVPVNDERGYSLRPGFKDTATGLSVNSLGFRGKEIDTTKKKKIIADLGDSVPFGAGVTDHETYSYYLDSLLSANGHPEMGVLNAGVPSYNMAQSFYTLKNKVMDLYHPHIITVQAANDMSLVTSYRDKWTPDINWGKARLSSSWYQNQNTNSAILYYIYNTFRKPEPGENHKAFDGKNMLTYIKNDMLPGLIAYCRENNIAVILMPIDPFYYSPVTSEKNSDLKQWNDKNYRGYVEIWDKIIVDFNKILEEAVKENENIYYFDTRSMLNKLNRKDLYKDFIHYSPEGNRIVAMELLNFMKTKKLIN